MQDMYEKYEAARSALEFIELVQEVGMHAAIEKTGTRVANDMGYPGGEQLADYTPHALRDIYYGQYQVGMIETSIERLKNASKQIDILIDLAQLQPQQEDSIRAEREELYHFSGALSLYVNQLVTRLMESTDSPKQELQTLYHESFIPAHRDYMTLEDRLMRVSENVSSIIRKPDSELISELDDLRMEAVGLAATQLSNKCQFAFVLQVFDQVRGMSEEEWAMTGMEIYELKDSFPIEAASLGREQFDQMKGMTRALLKGKEAGIPNYYYPVFKGAMPLDFGM